MPASKIQAKWNRGVVAVLRMPSFTSQMSCPLSQREAQCLEGLARGLSNSDIAKHLNISVATVALHLGNARRKLGAKTREQAVALAVEQGFVSPTPGYASRI